MDYFEDENSIFYNSRTDIPHALETIASRYIGQNPIIPFTFRKSYGREFKRLENFKYILDFNEKFPNTKNEYVSKAASSLWADEETTMNLSIECFSPNEVFCNNQIIFKSNINDENDRRNPHVFSAKLIKGWNSIVIKSKKTNSGFGCNFGTNSMKGFPLHFVITEGQTSGCEGFLYTKPEPEFFEGKTIWLPEQNWSKPQLEVGQFERIYGHQDAVYGIAWMKGFFKEYGANEYILKGKSYGALIIYMDGKEVVNIMDAGEFSAVVKVVCGEHNIVVKAYSSKVGWGFELYSNDTLELYTPVAIEGTNENMIVVGPFDQKTSIDLEKIQTMNNLFEGKYGETYWRLDEPGAEIRAFQEGKSLFGKWNYPLGVTLYGLLRSAIALDKKDITEYVKKHIELCTSYYNYSVWDRAQYGAPGINYQISGIDSLDDCGSFASTMLELMQTKSLEGGKAVADDVAEYITHKQSRLPDGALFRKNCYNPFMEDTLWADDLYMSVPFLCKYYRLTGKIQYIDDAAKQFVLFKKYLYIPDEKIMSHVYNFRIGAATGVAWGRGNGWVLFSLTELLELLPKEHKLRDELIQFFNELSQGYIELQDGMGMWHQVLTDPESYSESSCTSMFVYAFSRGVRFGWLQDKDKYSKAVFKAWAALTKKTIDKYGNIYGICKGSGYSYSPSYYKNDLTWNLNDTHGTGIVMLAGLETLNLINQL